MSKNINKNDVFLTPAQAARLLNVSLSTLKKFIYQGKIGTLKTPGGHHRILRSDLFNLRANIPQETPSQPTNQPMLSICEGLINVLETKRKFCQGHSKAVAELSLRIAKALDYTFAQTQTLYYAACLHDIGMIGIVDDVLNKTGALNEEEYTAIKRHSIIGETIAESIAQLKNAGHIIRQHHERVDGKGYPDNLSGEAICQEAKIIAVAESFNVMTSQDTYGKRFSYVEALAQIEKNSATQFDPETVKAFLKIQNY
jgi:excisionase family DNA binding protein